MDSTSLCVTDVTRGSVLERWNERHPEAQILKGDIIVEINGNRGSAKRMLRSVFTSITCKMVVQSCESNRNLQKMVQLQFRDLSSSDLLLFADMFGNDSRDTKVDLPRLTLPRVKASECHECAEQCCPICLADFHPKLELAQLPCQHVFCVQCIEDWMKRSRECPMCQVPVDTTRSERVSKTEPHRESDIVGLDEVGAEFVEHEPHFMEFPGLHDKIITATRGREIGK
jgi:hypothetical protein